MGVERVDYSSDQEFQQAQADEMAMYAEWEAERQADEEAAMYGEQMSQPPAKSKGGAQRGGGGVMKDDRMMEDDYGSARMATATFEILAEQIIDMLISGKLVTMQCVHDAEHGVLATWSPAALEQIASHIQAVVQPDEDVESGEVLQQPALQKQKEQATTHNKTRTKVGREIIEIDTSIVPLVETLNEYGIKTMASCEGDDRGYVAIDIDNVDVWIGKVNGKQETMFSLRLKAPVEVSQ